MPARKPTQLKVLEGTARADRLKAGEPKPAPGLPRAPAWLPAAARSHYRRLARLVAILKVGARTDGEQLGAAACALLEYLEHDAVIRAEGLMLSRSTERGELRFRHPLLSARADAWRRYVAALEAFGLNPRARGNVEALEQPEAPEGAARYFRGGAGGA